MQDLEPEEKVVYEFEFLNITSVSHAVARVRVRSIHECLIISS